MTNSTQKASAQRLRQVDPAIVSAMKCAIVNQRDESLTAQFGLSYNTWCKIREGRPIRVSLAERVELRNRLLIADHRSELGLVIANANDIASANSMTRVAMTEEARFELAVARELSGDVDF